ncbi:hypothetical protein MNEG_16484 [Monoraphidium neglectum]|uniref:Protein kinase domain-containing protein n=1 Tax=Monoraphidium neglectum TaxID=145388 RepID=A0A0D2M7K8_9CHLO|nr:hypothetical protein MNEG_16484 [Monoraphidium neglectum]KIY91480.1 hypothetical protein MNEG_16484 [Monoraphidium neglectum]|eukprot:XP_013890500.1 hypothetical protein MNEG_16484 [Monoraphidium neglectum]
MYRNRYTRGRIIGHGAYSVVYEGTQITTGRLVAIKSIPKAEGWLEAAAQRDGVVREIAVLRRLTGHPGALSLIDLSEGPGHYHLVTELCTGGELFDQIIGRGHFDERAAADLARALLSFIAFCHARGVVHRDLKPENIMLAHGGEGAAVKIVDYGTSAFCLPNERLHEKLGTPYYVAPEVLLKDYGCAADVWSAGVITYILLCGCPPFGGRSDERILSKVARGSYSFAGRAAGLSPARPL